MLLLHLGVLHDTPTYQRQWSTIQPGSIVFLHPTFATVLPFASSNLWLALPARQINQSTPTMSWSPNKGATSRMAVPNTKLLYQESLDQRGTRLPNQLLSGCGLDQDSMLESSPGPYILRRQEKVFGYTWSNHQPLPWRSWPQWIPLMDSNKTQ